MSGRPLSIEDWSPSDRVSVEDYLHHNSYRSIEHRLLYVATPKVACTTLKWWFASLEGCTEAIYKIVDTKESVSDLSIHAAFARVAPEVTGLTLTDLRGAIESDTYFRYALVRNPYKRVFSAWQSKILMRESLQIKPYTNTKFNQTQLEDIADISKAFEYFLEYIAEYESSSASDHHWAPQIDLLRPDLIEYSCIAKIERPGKLKEALAEWLADPRIDPLGARRKNESLLPYAEHFISTRSAELIRKLYRRDFDEFGYDQKPPKDGNDASVHQSQIALTAISSIRDRNQRIGELNELTENYRNLLIQHERQIEILSATQADRDKRISELSETIAKYELRKSDSAATLTHQEELISRLTAGLATLEQQFSVLIRSVSERDKRISQLVEKTAAGNGPPQDTTEDRSVSQIIQLRDAVERLESRMIQQAEDSKARDQVPPPSLEEDKVTASEHRGMSQPEDPEVEAIRQSGLFDPTYYIAMYPDIQPTPTDPIRHYCEHGWREGRNPSSEFDTLGYLEAYSDIRNAKINPFWHYIIAGRSEARQAAPGHTVEFEDDIQFGDLICDVTLIAYYLVNNSKQKEQYGKSRYVNALSPLPAVVRTNSDDMHSNSLSYDVALARKHGISAFCFNYDLECAPEPSDPLSVFITRSEINFKFVVDVDLRSMKFDEQGIQLLRLALADPRNLRIDERPVLVLTLPEDVAQCCEAISTISAMLIHDHKLYRIGRRTVAKTSGASSSHIVSLEAELDFPIDPIPGETGSFRPIDRFGFNCVPFGVAVSQAIARMKARGEDAPPQYRAITVGRDETPYKPVSSLIYTDFRNDEYRRWLEAAISDVKTRFEGGRRLLFLNAWNDWKQGAVLEPTQQTGFSKLNETTRTLLGAPLGRTYPKVSVIVPNYNHAKYLTRRLDSIYRQSYRNIEVLLLDDCSTDHSRDILTEYSERYPEVTTTIYNQENSGGVFWQWAKGIEATTGDLVWIAESDDYCDENFLETLVKCFEDEAVLLAYSKTEFVSTDETVMPNEFQHHVRTLKCREKWEHSYLNTAHREVSEALGIINTIPNASGAIFRRPVDMPLLNDVEWLSMRVAGDWIFYLHLIRGGKIAYSIDTTNYFRRGDGSAAARSLKTDEFYQELGLAARTVSRLYDVPTLVIEQALERSWELYSHYSDGDRSKFSNLYNQPAAFDEQNRRTPNVLITTMGFYPGGAEILPIRIANELKRQGYSVLLLSTGLLGNKEDGVRRLLRRDVPLVETSDIGLTREIIREFGIEILNSHQWHVQKYPVTTADAFVDLRGHVASLHGMIEHGDAFGVTAKQLRRADDFVSTWVYTADKNLDPFKKYGIYQAKPCKFVKLPNGMEPPTIRPVHRSDLGIPSDAFLLCCVSRAIPDKGWAETIAAVTRARETTGRDIRLILVGNGPLYDAYRKSGMPPFVYLVGFSENSVGYYAASDMGIMLTKFKSESFPLTIVDCLFAGKPFIATAVGEISNMLSTESGPAGQVIDLLEWEVPIDAAARAIAKFATDPDALRTCEKVVPLAASRYRIDGLVKQYGQIFEQTKVSFKETLALRLLRWLRGYSVYN